MIRHGAAMHASFVLALVSLFVGVAVACGESATPARPSPPPAPAPSPAPEPSPSPGPDPAPATASLSGVVTASGTGMRLTGAEVTLLDGPDAGTTVTTTDGEYRFAEIAAGNVNVAARAPGYAEARRGVFAEGATTLNFQLTESAPLVTFGPGQHRVGSAVPPGRYFADPAAGCYWERQSGTSGTAAETIAFEFVGYDAAQWIVDILPSDAAFQANAACGTWSNRPEAGRQAAIAPGAWVVGTQVIAGTYRSSAAPGCSWERLRDFAGTAASVVATEFVGTGGTAFVTIAAEDEGFTSNASCGTWIHTAVEEVAATP